MKKIIYVFCGFCVSTLLYLAFLFIIFDEEVSAYIGKIFRLWNTFDA